MSRITACMQALANKNSTALIPYIVAGDPNPEFTVPMMHRLVERGADIIELGVPFSDPMAEGPVIQLAHERALEHNVSLKDALAMVKVFRQRDDKTPVVLMGYANPVMRMGHESFVQQAADAGLDGLLTVDLPPEEAEGLNQVLKTKFIDSIFLVAPTTAESRIKHIAELATGYLYYVSLKGVTGAGNLDVNSVQEKLTQIRAYTDLPVAVGFGIKDTETAVAIGRLASGVVVGSALVSKAAELAANNTSANQDDVIDQATQLIADMRAGLDAI